jgi:hypothetical protein
VQLE